MDKNPETNEVALVDFDRALGEWMEGHSPVAEAIAASVQKRLRMLRWMRVLIPVSALIIGLLLFAPFLLRIASGVTGMVAIDWTLMTDVEALIASLRQLPVMVWILLAVTLSMMGVGLSER
ncbi:MAG: hypothetical protein AAAFM81_03840 [Pseudomonadota bacterium]